MSLQQKAPASSELALRRMACKRHPALCNAQLAAKPLHARCRSAAGFSNPQNKSNLPRKTTCCLATSERAAGTSATASKYSWNFDKQPTLSDAKAARQVVDLPVAAIRRPLGRTRTNDAEKVQALMDSIQAIGLQEPIDVLEVDGVFYGFSGCHRFEAHQRLGLDTIKCWVRKATPSVLKMHMS